MSRGFNSSIWAFVIFCFSHQRHLVLAVLTCVGDGPCRCSFDDGSGVVDISSLGNQNGSARFLDAVATFDGQIYSYNPCFPMHEGGCQDAAACKKEMGGNDYTDMGKQANYDWSYTGYYPLVTYSTGGGKKTEVMLICDVSKSTPQLDVVGEVIPGTLSLNLWSMCACPNKCPRVDPSKPDSGSLTTGTIVLIIFFSVLFVYLVGGILLNVARTRTCSKELIPNYNFWSSCPGLVADGCCCLFTCVKSKGKKYDAI